jgi:chromodomain-helicase-DNA-binding protein 7
MFDRASKKLGMEQALFQKGAFGHSDEVNDVSKINPEEVEKLLKYGAYAFMEEEETDEQKNANNIKIEDILKGRDKKHHHKHEKKQAYTLQKTTFNVQEGSAKDSGRTSASKTTGEAKKEKLNINDPNFWEKVLPFDGYNPKQLARKLRSNRNDIMQSKET